MTVMKKIVLLAFLACALDSQAQTMIPLYDGPVPNSKPCGKKKTIRLKEEWLVSSLHHCMFTSQR
jgi:hypothetical protein